MGVRERERGAMESNRRIRRKEREKEKEREREHTLHYSKVCVRVCACTERW